MSSVWLRKIWAKFVYTRVAPEVFPSIRHLKPESKSNEPDVIDHHPICFQENLLIFAGNTTVLCVNYDHP